MTVCEITIKQENAVLTHTHFPLKLSKLTIQMVEQQYLSIYGIYIAPLQGNYSEALPAQAWAKRKVLRRQ